MTSTALRMCLNTSDNSSSIGVGYAMTYATAKGRAFGIQTTAMESIPTTRQGYREYRTHENNLHFFEKKEYMVTGIDINGLVNLMDISYDPNN
ncbi:hypothetical protein TNCV_4364661 [Trichonephila clavipes]|nr:hypothetical protein TNCV_4364661 [Trichonephila clavipes]